MHLNELHNISSASYDVQVRRLVGSMRMASTRQAVAGSASVRETPVVEACQVLTTLVTDSADRKPIFLAEGGVIALMELLEERSNKVSTCLNIMFLCMSSTAMNSSATCTVLVCYPVRPYSADIA